MHPVALSTFLGMAAKSVRASEWPTAGEADALDMVDNVAVAGVSHYNGVVVHDRAVRVRSQRPIVNGYVGIAAGDLAVAYDELGTSGCSSVRNAVDVRCGVLYVGVEFRRMQPTKNASICGVVRW